MRFRTIPYLMAAAGLVQVGGSPIRIAQIDGVEEGAGAGALAFKSIRLGRPAVGAAAVENANPVIPHFSVIHVGDTVRPIGADGLTHLPHELPIMPLPYVSDSPPNSHPHPHQRRPCGRFRAKALRISNALRKAIGMPLIDPHEGMTLIRVGSTATTEHPHPHPHGHGPPHHHTHHGHHNTHGPHVYRMRTSIMEQSFMRRLHFALTSLGPWEGRAVAFVLGCGIGVLLRMFWVLTVIAYRLIRGSPSPPDYYAAYDDSGEYRHILFEQEPYQCDAEDLVVPPPSFVYVDEKVVPIVDVREEEKRDVDADAK